nr:uncharacterized protein LOC112276702 isoform X2 [Physcomitrium patens]|eukprot:XP_024364043.1 uncharacterized protein LOC112276702 isoform X2 [Physcomitrella patens]
MGVVTNKDEYFRKHSRNARGRAQIISKKTSACSVEERGREIDPGKHAQIGAAYDSMILVEWLGPVVSASHDRLHSSVCSVGGVTIRVQDTAFFRSKSLDVAPYIARIQALWEDQGSGQKWVRVNWCYYPSDLPVNMCRPVISDPREGECCGYLKIKWLAIRGFEAVKKCDCSPLIVDGFMMRQGVYFELLWIYLPEMVFE